MSLRVQLAGVNAIPYPYEYVSTRTWVNEHIIMDR